MGIDNERSCASEWIFLRYSVLPCQLLAGKLPGGSLCAPDMGILLQIILRTGETFWNRTALIRNSLVMRSS